MTLSIILGMGMILFFFIGAMLYFNREQPMISFAFLFLTILQFLVFVAVIAAEAKEVSMGDFMVNYLAIFLIVGGFILVGMVITTIVAALSFGSSATSKRWGNDKW